MTAARIFWNDPVHTSPNGIYLIKSSEGFCPEPTPDAMGTKQIGHGHDILPGETFPTPMTLAQADALLVHDVTARYEPVLNAALAKYGMTPNQNQYDALVDFTYEFEHGIYQLLAHGWDQITAQLPRWDHALKDGVEVEVPGILARREREIALYNS